MNEQALYIERPARTIDLTPAPIQATQEDEVIFLAMEMTGKIIGAMACLCAIALLVHYLNWWVVPAILLAGVIRLLARMGGWY